jgi:hypothetical protein
VSTSVTAFLGYTLRSSAWSSPTPPRPPD